MIKYGTVAAALVAFASAECPNACSGHGECGQKDMCSCYNNYQGNDCSERTCYFGIAHVDTPKGDLNADGLVSGPLTTVITGSEVYPWGTTEQYPNADANEGHFYMECSNKGICDRKSGECECFDGYEGTACVRASCPNDCSGHGTCESIKELAELKTYDTNAGDVPTTQPNGQSATQHHNFNTLIEESYSYDLWDADKTMGCKCDPVYYGADCSLKKCKYGVDPLFYDDADGVIYQTTVVHLGAKGTNAANIGGTFNIEFYDVFGEKYATKPISAATSELTSTKVVEAFEALPNGVISKTNTDVTRTAPAAVTVSVQADAGELTYSGTIGAGKAGNSGAGIGAFGSYGPEFTVTFSSNPGILKTIELDTRQVTSQGTTDYWVANMRQGQFNSRYTDTVGRVNTLLYGSKYLYTNAAPGTLGIAADDLLKVNGQEFLAAAKDDTSKFITLNEPFMGASIIPILTDTGALATAVDSGSSPATFTLKGTTQVTTANTDSLQAGASLYLQGEPFVSKTTPALAAASLEIEPTASLFFFNSDEQTIYRRTDDPDNQNFYKAAQDTGKLAQDTYCAARGSTKIYPCAADSGSKVTASYGAADGVITLGADASADKTDFGLFTGLEGPYKIAGGTYPAAALNIVGTDTGLTGFEDYFDKAGATAKVPALFTKAATDTINTGTMVLMNGRRYKIKGSTATSANAAGVGAGTVVGTEIELTETFSGQHLLEKCSACVDKIVDSGNGVSVVALNAGTTINIGENEALVAGGSVQYDQVFYSDAAITQGDGTGADMTMNYLKTSATAQAAAGTDVSLFQLTSQPGMNIVLITENSAQTTYQYVSQCSNRGACDSSTGVCACFKGYTNDNCDTQNMLAM